MKDKRLASDDRIRVVCILTQEFSSFPFILNSSPVEKTAKVLNVSPNTVRRYIRESHEYFRNITFKLLGEEKSLELMESLKRVPDKTRAVAVLSMNGFNWEEIGKHLRMSSEAAQKRFRRLKNNKSFKKLLIKKL